VTPHNLANPNVVTTVGVRKGVRRGAESIFNDPSATGNLSFDARCISLISPQLSIVRPLIDGSLRPPGTPLFSPVAKNTVAEKP
jgi:hypothetical protein